MNRFLRTGSAFLLAVSAVFCIPLSGQQKKDDFKFKTRQEVKYNPVVDSKNPMAVSENKVAHIRKVVQSYVDHKDDISDQHVINEIYDKIDNDFPIQPKGKPDNRLLKELRAEAVRLVKQDKRFAMEEAEYRKMLEATAAKIYKTYKPGDKVTLIYQKGNKRYRIKNETFYRFNGRSVSIGLRTVPYYDLIEEDKVKVNPAYAEAKRKEYVERELKEYLSLRKDAFLSKETELVKAQLKYNIDSGFVRYAEIWRYPIQVINTRLIESIEADPRFAGKVTGLNLDSIHRIQIKRTESFDRKELAERIRAYKEDAARRVGTIDSEQGLKNIIFWRFTKDEVKYALANNGWSLVQGKEYDKAVGFDQQVLETRLYYEKGRLVKVVTTYDIDSFDTFTQLRGNMLKSYGPDDRTKNKEFVRPGEPLSWKGIITDGYLNVKQNKDTGALEGKVTMTWQMVPLKDRKKRAELLNKEN
ncbi:MAG: hypothetical protein E7040_09020 [Lentisphaerae bacterium]|nr:hypothetical protein [Lentisphaerota bacterium]